MLISVLIPAYNHAEFIAQSVAAACRQKGEFQREILVRDDGSSQDIKQALDAYSKDITYVKQLNQGQSATRNQLLKDASGDFIAFLDDDDWWPEDKLAWQVASLQQCPEAVMVFGDCCLCENNKIQLSLPTFVPLDHRSSGQREFQQRLTVANPIRSPGQTLIRRSALEAIGGFDEALRGPDDWDLHLRLAQVGPILYQNRLALKCMPDAAKWSRNISEPGLVMVGSRLGGRRTVKFSMILAFLWRRCICKSRLKLVL
jgi:glycosyltransferase involved in cell wall biosynthesis